MNSGSVGSPRPQGSRFPRSARLLTAVDFKHVFAHPERSADRFFTVLSAPGRTSVARLGLAVSKKQVRRAVDRNRLKRLIREAFRHRRDELDAVDFVVMTRAAVNTADNGALRDSLARHFATLAARSAARQDRL